MIIFSMISKKIGIIMLDHIIYFNRLVNLEFANWFCALAGTGMFLIQFLLSTCGVSDQDRFDMRDGNDISEHSDARKFKWFSIQALTGLMMFGWTAITCQKQFGLQNISTIGISIAAGLFAALVTRSILKLAKRLQSSGNVYRIEDAIGREAYVYQCIPKGGMGKISISLQHFTHEIDAVSDHPEALPSFMHVKIIEKKDDNTVVVTPL
jgi:hypothetical protein